MKMKTQLLRSFSRVFYLSSLIAFIFTFDCTSGAGPARITRRTKHYASSPRSRCAFGDPKYFTGNYISTNKPGVRIKVPNFDVLFEDICKVSPLARQALDDECPGGLKALDKDADVYKWKVTDSYNPNRLWKQIDKIDKFDNKIPPIVRLRSTLHGPNKRRGETFSDVFSRQELRNQWDMANDVVEEIYTGNLDELKQYQHEKYGTCSMIGVGYVKTKQSVVSPREQMTLCGVQNFPNGASIIWAVELEESQNFLFPECQPKRVQRSTTHLFSTTIVPVEDDTTFDVEYVLQLEIGGFPGWLTGPVIVETIKKMFKWTDGYFRSDTLAQKLASLPDGEDKDSQNPEDLLEKEQTLLMPP
ncbi:hypothetical protein ACHAWO_008289 [Cyclotella atomus]|uniref:START domain-containing protein n=1 Tax=Cyclotella atomus TaxID=382360 RepID=A0ABD3MW20_9STRA